MSDVADVVAALRAAETFYWTTSHTARTHYDQLVLLRQKMEARPPAERPQKRAREAPAAPEGAAPAQKAARPQKRARDAAPAAAAASASSAAALPPWIANYAEDDDAPGTPRVAPDEDDASVGEFPAGTEITRGRIRDAIADTFPDITRSGPTTWSTPVGAEAERRAVRMVQEVHTASRRSAKKAFSKEFRAQAVALLVYLLKTTSLTYRDYSVFLRRVFSVEVVSSTTLSTWVKRYGAE